MEYDILVTKEPTNGYLARPLLIPELVVSGNDEREVLTRVQEAIVETIAQSHIVRIQVPMPEEAPHDPWLRFGGMWGDSEEWNKFEAEIDKFRREIDHETLAQELDYE